MCALVLCCSFVSSVVNANCVEVESKYSVKVYQHRQQAQSTVRRELFSSPFCCQYSRSSNRMIVSHNIRTTCSFVDYEYEHFLTTRLDIIARQ